MQLYKYSRSIITTDSFSLGQASLGTLFVRKYNIKHRSNSYLYIISIEHYFQSWFSNKRKDKWLKSFEKEYKFMSESMSPGFDLSQSK